MSADHTRAPIACSLDNAQLTDRRAVWEQLSQRALKSRRSSPSGVQLVYAAQDGVEDQLRELAELEAQCCSFADWSVRRRDDAVVLDVTAHGDGIAAVRGLFDVG